MRAYVDANAVIRWVEHADTISDALGSLIMRPAGLPIARPATSMLTLAEVLVKPLRLGAEAEGGGNRAWGELADYFRALMASETFDVVSVGSEILNDAAVVRATERAVKLPDAIHLATARLSGCSHFISGDHACRRAAARLGLQAVDLSAADLATLIAETP